MKEAIVFILWLTIFGTTVIRNVSELPRSRVDNSLHPTNICKSSIRNIIYPESTTIYKQTLKTYQYTQITKDTYYVYIPMFTIRPQNDLQTI